MNIKLHGSTDKYTIISPEDAELASVSKWYLSSSGYATSVRHRKGSSRLDTDRSDNVALHRIIMGNPPEEGLQVDHKNRDRLDNRRCNLRWVTPQQNMQNKSGYSKCGYKGVTPDGDKWSARCNGLNLGNYNTPRQAALAYDKAARHYQGDHCFLNLPEESYEGDVRHVDYEPEKVVRKSKYKGVTYYGHGGKRVKRWRATFRSKTIGYYLTEEAAAEAYNESKISY